MGLLPLQDPALITSSHVDGAKPLAENVPLIQTNSNPSLSVTESGAMSSGSASGEIEDKYNHEESESAGEMTLVEETFRGSTSTKHVPIPANGQTARIGDEDPESGGFSDPDITLYQVREETYSEENHVEPKPKRAKKNRKAPRQGVPMREVFSRRSIRCDLPYQGRQITGMTHTWSVATYARKTSRFATRERGKSCDITCQRSIWARISGGVTSTDPVRNKFQQSKSRNRKILTKQELAHEMPRFNHAEVVDIGERFSFYKDFLKRSRSTTALVTPESRSKT